MASSNPHFSLQQPLDLLPNDKGMRASGPVVNHGVFGHAEQVVDRGGQVARMWGFDVGRAAMLSEAP